MISGAFDFFRQRSVDLALSGIAVVLGVVALATLDLLTAIFAFVFAALTLHVVKTDLEKFEISDYTVVAIFVVGVAFVIFVADDPAPELLHAISRSVVAGGVLVAIGAAYRLKRKVEGLGWGDIKLAAAGAVWLSWQQMPFALLLAASAGIVLVVVHALREGKRPTAQMALPFGTVLAPAIWLVWFAGTLEF